MRGITSILILFIYIGVFGQNPVDTDTIINRMSGKDSREIINEDIKKGNTFAWKFNVIDTIHPDYWGTERSKVKDTKWRIEGILPILKPDIAPSKAQICKIDDDYFGRISALGDGLYYQKWSKDLTRSTNVQIYDVDDLSGDQNAGNDRSLIVNGDTVIAAYTHGSYSAYNDYSWVGFNISVSVDGGLTFGSSQEIYTRSDAYGWGQVTGKIVYAYGCYHFSTWYSPEYHVLSLGVPTSSKNESNIENKVISFEINGSGVASSIDTATITIGHGEYGKDYFDNPLVNEPCIEHFGGANWLAVIKGSRIGDGVAMYYSSDSAQTWTYSGLIGQSTIVGKSWTPSPWIGKIDNKPAVFVNFREHKMGAIFITENYDSIKTNPEFGWSLFAILNPTSLYLDNDTTPLGYETDANYGSWVEFEDRIISSFGWDGYLYDIRPSDLVDVNRSVVTSNVIRIPTNKILVGDDYVRLENTTKKIYGQLTAVNMDSVAGNPTKGLVNIGSSVYPVTVWNLPDDEDAKISGSLFLNSEPGRIKFMIRCVLKDDQSSATKVTRLRLSLANVFADSALSDMTAFTRYANATVPANNDTVFDIEVLLPDDEHIGSLSNNYILTLSRRYDLDIDSASGDLQVIGIFVEEGAYFMYDDNRIAETYTDNYSVPFGAIPYYRFNGRVDKSTGYVNLKFAPLDSDLNLLYDDACADSTESVFEKEYSPWGSNVASSAYVFNPKKIPLYLYRPQSWRYGTDFGFYLKSDEYGQLIWGELELGYIFK